MSFTTALSDQPTKLLARSYNIVACIGRFGNSLSHLILVLSQVLQQAGADSTSQTLKHAFLQAFASMSRELGRLMLSVALDCHQVWLAEVPLSEGCHCTHWSLPVVPDHIYIQYGPAAQQALECLWSGILRSPWY